MNFPDATLPAASDDTLPDVVPSPALAPRYRCRVLVVDDEPAVRALVAAQLAPEFDVATAGTAAAAERAFAGRPVDVVLTDLQLPDATGMQFLDWVQTHHPRVARLVLTGTARVEDAADAINRCHIHRLVLKPWRAEDLVALLRSVARGLFLERSHEELVGQLRRTHLELEERVQARTRELEVAMTQLTAKNQMLERMALTDPLTAAMNRRAIELVARKEFLRRTRAPQPIALGLVDADWFREVNAKYHLSGGDKVLTWLAGALAAAVRGSDAVGRVGGEEFMVVAPATDPAGAAILGERLRSAVEAGAAVYNGERIRVTVSVGIAVAPAGVGGAYEAVREVAAAALHQAKATGRNRAVVRVVG